MDEEVVYNIIPVNDVKEHSEYSTCECNPTIDIVNGVVIITHNSFDGREGLEMANEILNNK